MSNFRGFGGIGQKLSLQGGSQKLLLKTKDSIVITVFFLDHPVCVEILYVFIFTI